MSWKETNPLQLWKTSTIVPVQSDVDDIIEKTSITRRLSGTRSKLWTSFMEMTPENRKNYLEKLINGWPYKWERRAVVFPIHISNFATAISTSLISTKINADIHMCNPKARFMESLKSCTKIPIIFGIYTTGIMNFLLNSHLVYKPIVENEEKPCTSCILQRSIMISLFTGVIFPVVASPHLSYHIQLMRQPKGPVVAHHIDLITLSYEYSRSVWRSLPYHIIWQVSIATLTAYSLMWGRNRIFDTIDIDPELIREMMGQGKENKMKHFYYKVKKWLSQTAFINQNVEKGPIKGEDDKKDWNL